MKLHDCHSKSHSMASKEDVAKIGKKLENMIANGTSDHASSLDLLSTLKKMPMKLEVLQKTRIGMTVNNFRKSSSNDDAVSMAKSLIKSWKKLLPENTNNPSQTLSRSNSATSMSSTVSSQPADTDTTQDTVTPEVTEPATAETAEATEAAETPWATKTTDCVRLKCRELIANALKMDNPPEGSGTNLSELGAKIEDEIYREFDDTTTKYKNRVRSRVANLKDSRNPELRNNVLLGYIDPARIAVMTAEEMASDDMKALRSRFLKESIDDHQMAKTSGTSSDLLKCGKCGKRNCTYNQVQTRSADEPMTTFALCNVCGHRWKFC